VYFRERLGNWIGSRWHPNNARPLVAFHQRRKAQCCVPGREPTGIADTNGFAGVPRFLSRVLPPRFRRGGAAVDGRYCCKSPKLLRGIFCAKTQSILWSPISRAPSPLPRSPVSLSPGDEVPHMIIGKSHQRPSKILVGSAKGLLQQNRPQADMRDHG
jgi:hypothetical protein